MNGEYMESNNMETGAAGAPPISRFAGHATIAAAYILGAGSLLLFTVFLYTGAFDLVRLDLGPVGGLVLNACLSLIFFAVHSGMVRKSFRAGLAKFIRMEHHGAAYSIVSGVTLLAVVILWRETGPTLGQLQGLFRWLARTAFLLAIVGFIWGVRSLGKLDAFGIGLILRNLRGAGPPKPMPLAARGPYRLVRHPFYLFCLVMIWSSPDLTADRLLFDALWTAWIVAGTILEERDLVDEFGEKYREYQRTTPMLIPLRFYK
jgi:protein-S-isoprenylcysteine O-methyltransferase Ste14